MSLVAFAEGEQGEKIIDGKTKLAVPIAGWDGKSMGVGLKYDVSLYDFSSIFWGLGFPHLVIASYRGMKIAELVKEFGHETLAACWYSGNRIVHSSDKKYISEIESKIGRANIAGRF